MRLAALAFVALVAGAGPGWAQGADPYASRVEENDRKTLSEIKENALRNISDLYFAFGCKVFTNEGQFAALKQEYFMSGHGAMIEYRVLDLHWPEKVSQAMQDGLDKSRSDGCEYWQSNIGEVANLRRQALRSIRESLPYNLR